MNEYVVNYLKKDIEGYYFDKRNNEYWHWQRKTS